MFKKISLLLIASMAFIFFVQSVFAYTLDDLIDYLQSLISTSVQPTIIGGIFPQVICSKPCTDQNKYPSPNWCANLGACLPSCGHAGTTNGVQVQCSTQQCPSGQRELMSWDCNHCCVVGTTTATCTCSKRCQSSSDYFARLDCYFSNSCTQTDVNRCDCEYRNGIWNGVSCSISGTTSLNEPCRQIGCYPDPSCSLNYVQAFCIDKPTYDNNQNLFRLLDGTTYRCGNNFCTVACAFDSCCWHVRGYCYSTSTVFATGCAGQTGQIDPSFPNWACGQVGGISCGYTGVSVDPQGSYGPVRCLSSTTSPTTTTTTTTTSSPQCTEGNYRCNEKNLERCVMGAWQFSQSCEYGCSADHCLASTTTTTQSQCAEGSYRCNQNNLERCTNAQWTFVVECPYGCSGGRCITTPPATTTVAAPVQTTTTTERAATTTTTQLLCQEGKYRCLGSNLEWCVNGEWKFSQACSYGCLTDYCLPPTAITTVTTTQSEPTKIVTITEIQRITPTNTQTQPSEKQSTTEQITIPTIPLIVSVIGVVSFLGLFLYHRLRLGEYEALKNKWQR